MTTRIPVTIEATPKRAFASAVDWPGWCRSGKTEPLALEALAAAAARYAAVAAAVDDGEPFPASGELDLIVVERVDGSAGTDYGVPSSHTADDVRPMAAVEANRRASLVAAAWRFFDSVAEAAPEDLRKGPRGGGRDTPRIVDHVLDADRAYANQLGIKLPSFGPGDRGAVAAMRDEMLGLLRSARDGGPINGRRWTARYAARRIAWHALDHAWEIEDRTEREPA